MDERRSTGWPNQPGQGPPGVPPGQPSPPYSPPPGAPGGPAYPPPSAPPGWGPPGVPPPAQPPGVPPGYAPPRAPGAPPVKHYPPGYAPPPYYGQAPPSISAPAPAGIPSPKKRSPWIFIGVVIGLLIVAGIIASVVAFATRTPAITSLQLAHNFQDNKAVGLTDTFASTDPDLYAIIKLNTSRGHPIVKVVWTVINGTDANKRPVTGQEFGQVEKAATSNLLYASVARGSSSWPVGQYKAEVFLDGKLAKTAQFTVTT